MKNDFSISLKDRSEYVYGVDDIYQCWDTILKTIPNTIPLMPNFGSNIFRYIDKPVNIVFGEMANTIIRDLEFWERRAKIDRVVKEINPSSPSTVVLYIYGTYTSTGESIVSKFNLSEIFQELIFNLRGIGYDTIGNTLEVY